MIEDDVESTIRRIQNELKRKKIKSGRIVLDRKDYSIGVEIEIIGPKANPIIYVIVEIYSVSRIYKELFPHSEQNIFIVRNCIVDASSIIGQTHTERLGVSKDYIQALIEQTEVGFREFINKINGIDDILDFKLSEIDSDVDRRSFYSNNLIAAIISSLTGREYSRLIESARESKVESFRAKVAQLEDILKSRTNRGTQYLA